MSKIFGNLIATFAFLQFFRSSELSILHFVFFYENLTKISQHELKSGFFLSWSHIGWDSGFSSKIRIIPTKSGWLDSLSSSWLPSKSFNLYATVSILYLVFFCIPIFFDTSIFSALVQIYQLFLVFQFCHENLSSHSSNFFHGSGPVHSLQSCSFL